MLKICLPVFGQKAVKNVLQTVLHSRPLEVYNGLEICLKKFETDLTQYYGDIDNLLNSANYACEVQAMNELLQRVLKLPQLLTEPNRQKINCCIYNFIGLELEKKCDGRFNKQRSGETDIFAWVDRNASLDPAKDYTSFIAAFVGQFWIVAKVEESESGIKKE